MLKISLLGGFAVGGAVEGPKTRKAVFLLAYLALLSRIASWAATPRRRRRTAR